MGKYEFLSKSIIENVGGKENINTVTHCITRLRFKLKDEEKANEEALKALAEVVTVVKAGGQYQVVIGNKVPLVYADVCEILGIQESTPVEEDSQDAPKGFLNKFIDIISSCFAPVLGALVACGIMKGFSALFTFIWGAGFTSSGLALVMNAIGDSMFYFMPVMLGYSSAKKFKVNPVVGMLIGAILCYPNIQTSALEAGEALGSIGILGNYYTTILGIPMIATNYTNSVLPVVIIVAFAGIIQKWAKKWCPELIQSFTVPFVTLSISLFIGLLVIGPVTVLFTNLLSTGFTALFEFSPLLTGLVLGLFWQVLIIFGLHWSAVPIAMINLANLGYDVLLIVTHPAVFAQTAALFAMTLKMKDKQKKAQAVPAMVSGLCGVTEPAIYGFTLPAKTPFIASCFAASIGNGLMCMLGVKRYVMGAGGVFGMVNYISPDGDITGIWIAAACIIVTMIISFILTTIMYKDKTK